MQRASGSTDDRTIADFGEQWSRYTDNSGYYGSVALLADIFGSLLAVSQLRGWRVAEIGSGTGRIVNMLLDVGVAHVTAIEPSEAFTVLEQNTAARQSQVKLVRDKGEAIGNERDLDLVISIGVLHHIERPEAIVLAARKSLRPGGKLIVWLYGREGNGLYLAMFGALRGITKRFPHRALAAVCSGLNILADLYIGACRILPLPMRNYVLQVFAKLARDKRYLVIYDQLNPAYARYYKREEAGRLLSDAGFSDVRLHHRHGYSWTVIGSAE